VFVSVDSAAGMMSGFAGFVKGKVLCEVLGAAFVTKDVAAAWKDGEGLLGWFVVAYGAAWLLTSL
jgi:hypothetical protein